MKVTKSSQQIIRHLAVLVGYFLLYSLFQVPVVIPLLQRQVSILEMILLIVLLFILMGALIASLWNKYRHLPALQTTWPPVKHAGLTFVGLFIIMFLIGLLSNLFPTSANQQELDLLAKKSPIMLNLFTIIFGPIIEEFIFRGLFFKYFFPKLKNNQQTVLAIILSGVIFGLMHAPTFNLVVIPYILAGCLLATTYVLYQGDMRYNIALHFLNNLIASL